jgi:hypothetical protein
MLKVKMQLFAEIARAEAKLEVKSNKKKRPYVR